MGAGVRTRNDLVAETLRIHELLQCDACFLTFYFT